MCTLRIKFDWKFIDLAQENYLILSLKSLYKGGKSSNRELTVYNAN